MTTITLYHKSIIPEQFMHQIPPILRIPWQANFRRISIFLCPSFPTLYAKRQRRRSPDPSSRRCAVCAVLTTAFQKFLCSRRHEEKLQEDLTKWKKKKWKTNSSRAQVWSCTFAIGRVHYSIVSVNQSCHEIWSSRETARGTSPKRHPECQKGH